MLNLCDHPHLVRLHGALNGLHPVPSPQLLPIFSLSKTNLHSDIMVRSPDLNSQNALKTDCSGCFDFIDNSDRAVGRGCRGVALEREGAGQASLGELVFLKASNNELTDPFPVVPARSKHRRVLHRQGASSPRRFDFWPSRLTFEYPFPPHPPTRLPGGPRIVLA